MTRLVCLLICSTTLALAAPVARAQSLEDLELKKSQGKTVAKKKSFASQLGFGFLGIFETASGLNRDRPQVSSLLWLAPQLKYKNIYRLQLNMGLYGNYLDRATNPWDLTDWSLQLSALRLYKEKKSGIAFSGNLRYYLPTSNASRRSGSYGAVRALLKATRSVWKLYFGLELMASYHFSKYTTWDPAQADPGHVMTEDMIQSNSQATFAERLILSYSPLKWLTLSFMWTWYQLAAYDADTAPEGIGSSFVQDGRASGQWEFAWSCVFDATFHVWKQLYVSGGYSASAPALQADRSGTHYNPFDAKYGQVYLDLMFIY